MDKREHEVEVFSRIDRMLVRWRKELTEPAVDKPELAEEGINLLYKTAGKEPPLILWCDSPIQMALIPTLVANVLRSDSWNALAANMRSASSLDSNERERQWKSQWIRVEKSTALPLLDRIWNFQFKDENASIQQKVLARLCEQMLVILNDGRLNAETVHTRKIKQLKTGFWPGPACFDLWRQFIKLTATIERETSTDFNFNAATVQGVVFGVFDHRAITNHIPVARDLLKSGDEQTEFFERVQHIRAKCEELDRISNTRAVWLTEAMTGFVRPAWVPDINIDKEWHEVLWSTVDGARKDVERRLEDPRATSMVVWGASAAWLPLALSCRMLDSNFLLDLEDEIDSWAYMFHGASGYYLGDRVCFVCRQPETLAINESGQPHNPRGAAASWRDGFDVHSWRGIVVDPDLIARANSVSINQILSEENAEIRRILLDMFGEERFVQESGATVIHQDKYGVLYHYAFNSDEPLMMVRVRNSTPELDGTYKDYYLRVPPGMTKAKEAVAWTFGLRADEYDPEHES
ncbi:MAG: hypothetical protein K8F91_02595 [Candidatus Obscuribacterales bacterium]|nr:hypothetical protein [Candidatus Obscuribacterales bacterium]